MAFFQTPPELGNQYVADDVLRRYLRNTLPPDVLTHVEPELNDLGELAGGDLYRMQLETHKDEPTLTPWDAWGNRIDHIELTPLWKRAARITAEKGIVATAYEKRHGAFSRIHQMALLYVIDASWSVYSCPLAMTDGAAKTLLVSKNQKLIDRALPRLTSRDPDKAWTSGQWMTERTGGSDVAICETIAKADGDAFRLFGTKWFSSATTSQMTLTLGRPEGNPPGGSGLALFYVEVRDEQGRMNNILVNRMKDKLGTRMVPTAELTLDGARAVPVYGLEDGIKNITPMLAITRTWNAVGAVAGMRRAIALAKDYARRRVAFGAPLADKPLHVDTLAQL
jgi:acyl-CoA dehydrogenase